MKSNKWEWLKDMTAMHLPGDAESRLIFVACAMATTEHAADGGGDTWSPVEQNHYVANAYDRLGWSGQKVAEMTSAQRKSLYSALDRAMAWLIETGTTTNKTIKTTSRGISFGDFGKGLGFSSN